MRNNLFTRFFAAAPTARATSVPVVLAFSVLCAGFLAGCDLFAYKRIFDDAYYDNNFIAAIDFDAKADVDAVPSAVDPDTGALVEETGVWDFAYRYQSWKGTPYMSLDPMPALDPYATPGSPGFSAASIAVPSGLSASAPVYRLEVLNFLEGGDFEGIADTAGLSGLGWVKDASTGTGASTLKLLLPTGGIHGNSVSFSLSSTNQYVTWTIPDTLVSGAAYRLSFNWESTTDKNHALLLSQVNGGTVSVPIYIEESSGNEQTAYGTGYIDFTAGASNVLVFTTDSVAEVVLDDLRISSKVSNKLRLLLKQGETNPPLESFLYRFTFWVCEDPTASLTSLPYRLPTFTPYMQKIEPYSSISAFASPVEYVVQDTPSWRKMTLETQNGNLVLLDASGTVPVLELILNLDTDSQSTVTKIPASAGRILIAQPELRAYPDGY
mgnify:CR=1 FL=1